MCETPKSPPGDYNVHSCVWISTPPSAVRCETPKSLPGDYNRALLTSAISNRSVSCETPKSPPGDYNLTNASIGVAPSPRFSVKHLNPRQGITTARRSPPVSIRRRRWCETPKSPPGDYNKNGDGRAGRNINVSCETPKSPPGDYNLPRSASAGRAPQTV